VPPLGALAEHDRPEVTKIFTDLIKGKALDILLAPSARLEIDRCEVAT
jgi:hypothetical protein